MKNNKRKIHNESQMLKPPLVFLAFIQRFETLSKKKYLKNNLKNFKKKKAKESRLGVSNPSLASRRRKKKMKEDEDEKKKKM